MMKIRIIAMLLLLAMCLSVFHLGTVAYAKEISVDQDAISDQGTTAEETLKEYPGRVGNFTFFSDETLIKLFNFESESNPKETLYAFLEDVYTALSQVDYDKDIAEGKSSLVWSNYDEDGNIKFPIKYVNNGNDEEFMHLSDALNYMGSCHPLFSMDLGGKKVNVNEEGFVISITYDYFPAIAKETRDEIVKVTDPIITMLKGKREQEKNPLTDEQIVLLVYDYLTSIGQYDMGATKILDAYGTLVERRSVCQGQSAGISYILNSIGIPCEITIETQLWNHAWNTVTVGDNKYQLCLTGADVYRQGEIAHEYLMVSTRDYIIRKLGGLDAISASNYDPDYVYKATLGRMYGDFYEIDADGERIDLADDTTYETAFWRGVGSAFVLYENDLLFISKEGKLCLWEGGKEVQVEELKGRALDRVTTEDVTITLKNVDGTEILPGEWSQDQGEKFHKLVTQYDGKYYFSSDDTIYELTFCSEKGKDLTYSYKVFFDANEILRDGECIYDFYIHDNEIFFNIGKRFVTLERDGRHFYQYIGEEKIVNVPISHYMEDTVPIRHVFKVEKAAVENYVKDESSICLEYMSPYLNPQKKDDAEQKFTRVIGEYRNKAEITSDDLNYYFTVTQPQDAYPGYRENLAQEYASAPIMVALRMENSDGTTFRTQYVEYNSRNLYEIDTKINVYHSLDLANEIAINYLVPTAEIIDNERTFIRCEIPVYEDGEKTGVRYVNVTGVDRGDGYYCYSLRDLTAVNMVDEIRTEVFAVMEDGAKYHYTYPDYYSILTYATNQLNKPYATDALKTVCTELLRYGAKAQIFKGYRTDALADGGLTEEHTALLAPLEEVVFHNNYAVADELANPAATWVGKSLALDSKVVVRYVFDAPAYEKDMAVKTLSLKVTYTDIYGDEKTVTVTGCKGYGGKDYRYAFDFSELLSAEWRCVLSAAIYEGDTRISSVMTYSVDTYGLNKTGDLLAICRAMISFSDSAKEYFRGISQTTK